MSEGKDNALAKQEGQGVRKLRGLVLVQLAVQAPILLAALVGTRRMGGSAGRAAASMRPDDPLAHGWAGLSPRRRRN